SREDAPDGGVRPGGLPGPVRRTLGLAAPVRRAQAQESGTEPGSAKSSKKSGSVPGWRREIDRTGRRPDADPAGDPVRRLRHAAVAALARAPSEAAARVERRVHAAAG